ncbi:MAG: uroporphyrinogen III synthase [Methylophilaceae bacterium]|nr:MAG: uroporphyrinogen III synthase [Methylophilaceae bacterium]
MVASPKLALANIGVAITRPSNQARNLTQLIQAAGGNVISFPLIEIIPLEDYTLFESDIANINEYDWIIFISSNAVQNSMPRLLKHDISNHLQFAAIGPVTAKALSKFGIDNVLTPKDRFDSESLLSLPALQDMQGKKVMIVRGIGGREVLANTLKSRGAKITFAECYQRINPQTNCDVLMQACAKQQLHSIVVTSSEAMRHLLALSGDADWLKEITLCVNHARVAELPTQEGFKVNVSDAPGDEAMLESLKEINV